MTPDQAKQHAIDLIKAVAALILFQLIQEAVPLLQAYMTSHPVIQPVAQGTLGFLAIKSKLA